MASVIQGFQMINQATLIIAVLLVTLVFFIPRKYFLLLFIVAVCFIPFDQRIIIQGLDFTPLRFLIVFGVLRILVRGEQREIRWNLFDKLIFAWAICGAVVYVIQWADTRSLIYKSGMLFDLIGLYWLFRQNIRSWNEVGCIARALAIGAFISGLLVLVERVTQNNPFVLLGNVHTGIHRGRYRCTGSFEHSIMLGLFWANLVPIFVGYAITSPSKAFFWWAATATCVLIVVSTGSSTPMVVLLLIILLLPLFRYRRYGKIMALGFVVTVLALHIVMAKPVWHIIGRIRFIQGSTSYHRYLLIDSGIKHFDEWALLGTRSTSHWGYHLDDITNNYIRQGLDGGFATLALLVIIMVMGIKICGKYSLLSTPRRERWLSWAFAISVLGHSISFLGVSYFGKIPTLLYLTFAFVAMLSDRQKIMTGTQLVSTTPNWQNTAIGNY